MKIGKMERFLVLKWQNKIRRSAACYLPCRAMQAERMKIYKKATENEEASVQVSP
jgi:hypothetical protein